MKPDPSTIRRRLFSRFLDLHRVQTTKKERKKEGENTDQTDGILVVQVELVVWEEILYAVQLVYLLLAPFHQLKQQQTNTKLRICF